MRRTIALSVLVVSAMVLPSEQALSAQPGTLREGHPRLILTDERLDELRKLAVDEAPLAKAIRDVIGRADEYSLRPVLERKLSGPRLLGVSRQCLARVYALGLAYRWTGRAVYAERARDNLLAVCAFSDWNPSHFLDTAEMTHAVGIGYDWLYHYLDRESRSRIRAGLIAHGLTPGVDAYRGKKAWWVDNAFNWNQVCNSGLLIGALALADSDPQYAEVIVPEALRSLPRSLATYEPDGAWGEGPGYWNYATSYTVFALAALETALGSDQGLSDRTGLSRAARFPLLACGPTQLYLNYADSGQWARRRTLPTLFYLAKRYRDEAAALAEHQALSKRRAEPRHVIWYVPRPAHADALPLDVHLRGPVAVALMRSAWDDPDALFVGVKAGYNRVAHGHLDLGNFELDALGVRWARDLGSEDYNLPGYWSGSRQDGKRWSYYRLNSHSHNVPMLDGEDQSIDGKAEITAFAASTDGARAVVDFSSAYPQAQTARRGVAMLPGRRAVLIQDEFDLADSREFVWGMTTDAEIALEGSQALLTIKGKHLRVSILAPGTAVFSVASAEQSRPQKTNKGVRRLEIRLEADAGLLTAAVLLEPLWPDSPAPNRPKVSPLADWFAE
jgi:heparinase II/III-like protein